MAPSAISRMCRSLLWAVVLAVLAAGAGCRGTAVTRSTSGFPAGTGFIQQHVPIDGQSRTIWIFIPHDYDPSRQYPAIVFLHGLFEAGSDGTAALSAGLGPVIAKAPHDWPFIVLFPQSSGTWRGEDRERLVIQSLDWAEQTYSIDRRRVILAGLSYGGLGTWQIGSRHAHRFAALVPVSGKHDLACADGLRGLPVWAFHNRADPIVPAEGSRAMCEQITRLGGQARYTGFAQFGHDCWDRAVEQTGLVQWMLEQRAHPQLPPHAPFTAIE